MQNFSKNVDCLKRGDICCWRARKNRSSEVDPGNRSEQRNSPMPNPGRIFAPARIIGDEIDASFRNSGVGQSAQSSTLHMLSIMPGYLLPTTQMSTASLTISLNSAVQQSSTHLSTLSDNSCNYVSKKSGKVYGIGPMTQLKVRQ